MVDQAQVRSALRAGGVRGHPNWLAPDWLREVTGPPTLDGTEWVRRVADAGVGSLLFVTKGHDGMCYWPTNLSSPHTEGDLLGEVCTEGARSNVRIYAYYSAAIDDFQVREHPDWAFEDRSGRGSEAIGFRWACLNSPYGAFVRAQVAEILENYAVDSIWLDIYALGPRDRDCVCRWCRALYRERHGGELAAVTDPSVLGDWKVDCLAEQLRAIREDRDRLRPGAIIAFNGAGAGFRRHPEATLSALRLFDLVDFLSDEGHDPRFESAMAKAMRAHGRPFEVLTSNGIANEWLGWVTKPAGLLSLEGAVVGSHGGSFGLGLSVLPNGEMPEGELAVVGEATEFLKAREPWFTPQDPASDVRILIQTFRERSDFVPPERPPSQPRLPRDGAHHSPPVYDPDPIANGLWDALKEAHLPFDFVHEYRSLENISTLFLQGSARLSAAYCEALREFVRGGGTLVAESHATLLDEDGRRREDFALADVLGLRFRGYAGAWDANYIQVDEPALRSGLPDYPLLITGQCIQVTADGAAVLARVIPPIGGEQTITRHVAALYNPPGAVSDDPAITVHTYGAGRTIYIAQELGAHIRARRDVDPWTKRLVANIAVMAREPFLQTSAPPGVELVVNRAPHGGLWLHMLNHYARAPELGAVPAPEIAPITVSLDQGRLGRIVSATAQPSRVDLPLERDAGDRVTLMAPAFSVHQVIDLRFEPVR